MAVRTVPAGIRGFDCNFPLSSEHARAMLQQGFRFVLRYVPRITQAANDLTLAETLRLLVAGLAVMPVQHVEREDWTPSLAKGVSYGTHAAQAAVLCGIGFGTTLWLDLEGVLLGVDADSVIQYCNAWYDAVSAAGYLPGIYVGWHAILTPDQLYRRLKFTRYWSAYNLDTEQFPAVVGVCMMQGVAQQRFDYPAGWHVRNAPIDTNLVLGDAEGRVPTVTAPTDWNVWR